MEEPDRAASVPILEDEQSRKNGVPNREFGQGRPLADPQAKAWLDSMQRFRLEREHQINQIFQREAYGSLSKQDKLSFAWEAEKFRAAEEGFRKFMKRGHK